MTGTRTGGSVPVVMEGGTMDLVRGSEHKFLARLAPLVRRQSVSLDLGAVTRIDAAGVAALVSLYRGAREAGHSFTVCNPSRRVEEVLALFGLDQVLVLRHPERLPRLRLAFERSAA